MCVYIPVTYMYEFGDWRRPASCTKMEHQKTQIKLHLEHSVRFRHTLKDLRKHTACFQVIAGASNTNYNVFYYHPAEPHAVAVVEHWKSLENNFCALSAPAAHSENRFWQLSASKKSLPAHSEHVSVPLANIRQTQNYLRQPFFN